MMLRENFHEAVRSLLGKKQRTVLALLGIVIGIGSVIAMVSVGTIVQHETLKQFQEMGTDVVAMRKDVGYGGGSLKDQPLLKLSDALDMPRHVPMITEVAPYSSSYGKLTYAGKRMDSPALGVTEAFFDICNLDVLRGRGISDLDRMMYYCVVSTTVADFLAEQGAPDPLGEKLVYKDRVFKVVGVIGPTAMSAMKPYEVNEGIIIPAATSLRFMDRPEVSSMLARMVPGTGTQELQEAANRYFAFRSKGLAVKVRTAEDLIQQMQKQMRMFTLLLGAIGSIALVVGGVGVMNVMLVSVSERRREIGIRRALGAQQSDIQGQFLIESVLLCIAGGLLGILLGVGASYVIALVLDWTFMVSWPAVVLGIVVSCAVGVFFGYYPARQAARLNPILALRAD